MNTKNLAIALALLTVTTADAQLCPFNGSNNF
jgi:hypothetical protein